MAGVANVEDGRLNVNREKVSLVDFFEAGWTAMEGEVEVEKADDNGGNTLGEDEEVFHFVDGRVHDLLVEKGINNNKSFVVSTFGISVVDRPQLWVTELELQHHVLVNIVFLEDLIEEHEVVDASALCDGRRFGVRFVIPVLVNGREEDSNVSGRHFFLVIMDGVGEY